ncbi:MAG: DNA-packaging protein [Rhodobacteraceae bacterium]|nr:DNA-packaging protein [Paracoccaceae bacterium]
MRGKKLQTNSKKKLASPETTQSTSKPLGLRSGAFLIASETPEVQKAFLDALEEPDILALPYMFEFWAHEHQLPPDGNWRSWVVMGGRGAGKTRAGAEWVRAQVEGSRALDKGQARRVALVADTFDQVRDVMIFGESGILACSPSDRRPVWEATRRRLVWPNGATAQAFSANDPEGLRGPQFDAAWVDELAKWRKGQETWDMLQFALRLGTRPRQCVTTTPRNIGVLKSLLALPSTVVTRAPTEANRVHLAASFLEEVRARYAGTRIGRQELDGELLEDAEGALWTWSALDACRSKVPPLLDRIVVAVDPPVTGHSGSDACGIIVAGVDCSGPPPEWRAYVIEDASVTGASPQAWAEAAVDAMARHGADRLVAEVNQGGDLVETVIRQIDPMVPYRAVRASRGKTARAEPVAALYEQRRILHGPGLAQLEDEMCQMTTRGYDGAGSPDRVDALVWAIQDLMIEPAAGWRRPRVRTLS